MSDQNTSSKKPNHGRQPGGGRRSGNNQNRNRNRNREGGGGEGNNRNRNRNRNRSGGGGRQRQGQRQGQNPQRRSEPAPIPLTFWQKILKALGLYNPKKHTSPSRVPKPADAPKRNNARNENKGGKGPKRGERNSNKEGRKKSPPRDDAPVNTSRLYLGNLSYEATEYELEDLFKGIGPVKSIEVVYNRNTHKSKGYGFVVMRTVEDAKRAVEVLHDQPFMGRQLIVSGAKSSGPAESDSRAQQQERDSEPPADSDQTGGDDEEAAA